MNVPFSKLVPYAAGGVGLALLENQLLGENLSDPVKRVNYGLGATQGALMADPATRGQALASLPMKQMALVGLGSLDRFRRSQQGLVDTNLRTAKINEHTAKLVGRDSGGRKALLAAFLLPALAGGGALAYDAYRKHHHKSRGKFDTLSSSGQPPKHQRVKIEIPPSALPDDFFDSFSGLGQNPKTYSRLEGDQPPVNRRSRSDRMKKAHFYKQATQQPSGRPPILPMVGNWLAESSGIPSFARSVSDSGKSYINMEQGNHGEALRYGLAGLGGLGLGVASMRLGVYPLLGRLLGQKRLLGVMGRTGGGLGRQLTEFPTAARSIYNWSYGQPAMDAARNLRFRYDPTKFSWHSPAPSSTGFGKLFNRFLTSPASRATPPPMGLLGQVANVGRYGVNRGVNLAYRTKQLAMRNPNATLMLGASPLTGMGVMHDDDRINRAKQDLEGYVPDYARNKGPGGMPLSSALSGLLSGVGGPDANSPIRSQIAAPSVDPYRNMRYLGYVL